jgi:hypothetical protein
MTPEEFHALYPHVIRWIRQTLEVYSKQATAVASLGFPRLSQYFSADLLTLSKVVVVERVPMPPLSSLGLNRFAEFERGDYDGVTYLDTFFVKRRSAAALATYAAGLEAFGYRGSPLEIMAYNAETAFSQSDEIFDAEKLVAEKLSQMRNGMQVGSTEPI